MITLTKSQIGHNPVVYVWLESFVIIIPLMLSVWTCPKVIILCGLHCIIFQIRHFLSLTSLANVKIAKGKFGKFVKSPVCQMYISKVILFTHRIFLNDLIYSSTTLQTCQNSIELTIEQVCKIVSRYLHSANLVASYHCLVFSRVENNLVESETHGLL